MQAVPAALARAAKSARALAAHTDTPLVVVRDGRLIEVMVQPVIAKPEQVSPEGIETAHTA